MSKKLPIEDQLQQFYDLIPKVAEYHGREITVRDVSRYLMMLWEREHDLAHIVFIVDVVVDLDELFEILKKADFSFIDTVVEFSSDLIPYESMVGYYTKARVNVSNDIWVIHKNDPDPFPSKPHAHCYERGIKMDLRDGTCYDRHGRSYMLRSKEFLEIRARFQAKGIELPEMS